MIHPARNSPQTGNKQQTNKQHNNNNNKFRVESVRCEEEKPVIPMM